jgi:hypothetical protein
MPGTQTAGSGWFITDQHTPLAIQIEDGKRPSPQLLSLGR